MIFIVMLLIIDNMTAKQRTYTTHYPGLVAKDYADSLYIHLRDNTQWIDGIKSVKGFTRKAKPLCMGDDDSVDYIINTVCTAVKKHCDGYTLEGIYLNYYRDGNDWTPSHNHPGQRQIIISLGATRTLIVGKKAYLQGSGDVTVFGSSNHEVPKELDIKEGRISIALFFTPTSIIQEREVIAEQHVMTALQGLKLTDGQQVQLIDGGDGTVYAIVKDT
jgi:hypothetical protein